jgi:hypothetical protein
MFKITFLSLSPFAASCEERSYTNLIIFTFKNRACTMHTREEVKHKIASCIVSA